MTVIINGNTGIDTVQDAKISPAKLTTNGSGGFTLPTSAGNAIIADSSGRVTMPFQPAFDAVYTSPGGNIGTTTGNTAIIFNVTNTNRGNHYNTSNGRFTAPVAGVYLFSATGMTTGITWYEIRINGANIGNKHAPYATSSPSGEWSSASSTWILELNVGDFVQLFTGSSGAGMYGGGNNHNNFSGCLLG